MNTRKLLGLLMAAMLVLSMAACGGGGQPSSPAPAPASPSTPAPASTPEAPPAEPAPEPITMNVAYMPNYASLCEVVTADKAGYFAEEGITVNLVEFADGPTIISAMESGSIDVGYIGSGAHKLCIAGRAKIFAMAHVGNGDAIIGAKSKGVEKAADLKGKTVAYAAGTSSEQILQYTLEAEGLSMSDINAMEMDASAIVTAMMSGAIDACATWSPNTFTIREQMGDDAVTLADNLTYSDQSASVSSWIVLSDYAEKNADSILRFTRALYKAKDYRADEKNYEQVAKWIAEKCALDYEKVYTQRGDAEWLTAAELVATVKDGSMEKMYKVQQDNFIAAGAVEKEVPVSDYVMFDNMLNAAK